MGRHRYTPEQVQFIRDHIRGYSRVEMTEMFNSRFGCLLSVRQMSILLSNYRRCRRNIKTSSGGHLWARRPIGTERISDGRLQVKIADPDVWRYKHHIIWEAANGPIPEGHIVIFADRNKLNVKLDNLLLVSKREYFLMNRLGLILPDKDLTKTGKAIADLKILIADRQKKNRIKHRAEGGCEGHASGGIK